jgi:Protein of unknown function (DUF2934)
MAGVSSPVRSPAPGCARVTARCYDHEIRNFVNRKQGHSHVSSKKTRTITPVSPTPQEPQAEAAPKSRTAKAKAVPGAGASASPELSAAKPKAKPAAAGAAKPKLAAASARAPRAASSRTSLAATSTAPEQPIATAVIAAAVVAAPASAAVRVVTDEDIRIRAYFLSIEHRARGGSDIDFWLIAERELRHGIKAKD